MYLARKNPYLNFKPNVLGTQTNQLTKTFLLSTHNIGFNVVEGDTADQKPFDSLPRPLIFLDFAFHPDKYFFTLFNIQQICSKGLWNYLDKNMGNFFK